MPLCIVVLSYGYKTLLGRHVFWLDILIFLVAVSVGQVSSYLILAAGDQHSQLGWLGLLAAALLGASFAVFTFSPPHMPVFRDSVTGRYGLQE